VSAAAAIAVGGASLAAWLGRRSMRRHHVHIRLGVGGETRGIAMPDRLTAAAVLIGILVGWQILSGLLGALAGGVAGWGIAHWRARRSSRVPAVVAQERFADAIASLGAAVRSGASLPQALEYAATEAESPVRYPLEALVGDLRLGVPIEQALDRWRDAWDGAEVDLVVGALELHRRSGGDLPAVLDEVIASVRDRVSIAREVRTLTAQARLSAWILCLLPVGFFGFLWVAARSDVQGALGTPIGIVCIALGLILEGCAVLWIRSLIQIT
jgi:tight adherence protein B